MRLFKSELDGDGYWLVRAEKATLDDLKAALAERGLAAVPTEADDDLLAKLQTHGGLTQALTPQGLRAAYEFFVRKAQEPAK
jgi:hypothetical protein